MKVVYFILTTPCIPANWNIKFRDVVNEHVLCAKLIFIALMLPMVRYTTKVYFTWIYIFV